MPGSELDCRVIMSTSVLASKYKFIAKLTVLESLAALVDTVSRFCVMFVETIGMTPGAWREIPDPLRSVGPELQFAPLSVKVIDCPGEIFVT